MARVEIVVRGGRDAVGDVRDEAAPASRSQDIAVLARIGDELHRLPVRSLVLCVGPGRRQHATVELEVAEVEVTGIADVVRIPTRFPEESSGEVLHRLGVDAIAWAREFMMRCGDVHTIDEGMALAWFANAIEAAKDHGRREEQTRATLDRLRDPEPQISRDPDPF